MTETAAMIRQAYSGARLRPLDEHLFPIPSSTDEPPLHRASVKIGSRIARKLRKVYRRANGWTKHWFARGVYSLPFVSQYDPRGRVIKCRQHCRVVDRFPEDANGTVEDWYLQLRPLEKIQREASICLDESEQSRFRAGATKYQAGDCCELPEVFLAGIHNARIEGPDFIVCTNEGRILLESALSQQEVLEKSGIFNRLVRPAARTLGGRHALLAHPWARGYYHWLIEVLPKLSLLTQFEGLNSIPLIVPNRLSVFQRDSLRLAGVSDQRFVHLGAERGSWQIDELFFPEVLGPTGIPSPHAVEWLRKTFLYQESSPVSNSNGRIYLTRRDAPQRRILNEDEVIAFLRTKGFSVVCLSELPFAQQVELFRTASVVVAPHGAGLTNIVFAPPGTAVIEMFGDNYVNGCYWALANICGHRHACLTTPAKSLDYSVAIGRLGTLLYKVVGL